MRFIRENLSARGFLDKTGTTVSWICAVHCLLLPIALTALPLGGLSFLIDEKVEWLIISLSVAVGLASLLPAFFYNHGKIYILVLFGFGVGLMITSNLLFEDALVWKFILVPAGAGLISAAHLLNYRLCRTQTLTAREI